LLDLEESVHEGTPIDEAVAGSAEDAKDVEEDWEVLARQLPARDGTGVDASKQLGNRLFDLQYTWADKIGTYPNLQPDW
jgi:hypothetical protein